MGAKIKETFLKYEFKIILISGLILIAFISFEAGIIKGKGYAEKPIIIENAHFGQTFGEINNNESPEAKNPVQNSQDITETKISAAQNCIFLGSKNSNKYHLPSCRWAKNIKKENQVCFSSESDAKSKGYLPDKNCIK